MVPVDDSGRTGGGGTTANKKMIREMVLKHGLTQKKERRGRVAKVTGKSSKTGKRASWHQNAEEGTVWSPRLKHKSSRHDTKKKKRGGREKAGGF